MQSVGIGLLIIGAISFVIGSIRVRTARRVSADRGSVAVGGDNRAPISISYKGSLGGEKISFWTFWNIISGLATLLGLALTLWPLR